MMKFGMSIVIFLMISCISACAGHEPRSMEDQWQMERDFEDCMKKPFMYAQFIDCMQGKGYIVDTIRKDQQGK